MENDDVQMKYMRETESMKYDDGKGSYLTGDCDGGTVTERTNSDTDGGTEKRGRGTLTVGDENERRGESTMRRSGGQKQRRTED
ncbi:hypothetical protein SESBI_24500 [Sesbania bispinosa]|nr:hypothetical protein SESBI_24500 [Sesbania bispinosa]